MRSPPPALATPTYHTKQPGPSTTAPIASTESAPGIVSSSAASRNQGGKKKKKDKHRNKKKRNDDDQDTKFEKTTTDKTNSMEVGE